MSKTDNRSSTVPRRVVEMVLDEQRRRWREGERILVEAFLERVPALGSDRAVILDLIYNEIVLRENAGERPEQQEYARRFPDLSAELTMQFEVDRGLDWQLAKDIAALNGTNDPNPAREQQLSSAPNPTHESSSGTPFPLLPGYRIERVLGRGATGVVYKARQLSQDRSVAVKVVLNGMRRQADALIQLRADAHTLATLHDPHLCPIYEIGVDCGRLFIAQERVEKSLAQHQSESPVTPLQAAQWLQTLARTVHNIHQHGIVHGNLAFANILMSYGGILKITDIGLARFVDPSVRAVAAGTWNFRAPEQAAGNRDKITFSGDVYSLGAILFALLAVRPLETARRAITDSSALAPDVPRELETICLKCLHGEPDRRYESAAALADDLTAFLSDQPIRARRPGLLERTMRSVRQWSARTGSLWSTASAPPLVNEAAKQRLVATRAQYALELAGRLVRIANRDNLLRHLAELAAWLTDAELAIAFFLDRQHGDLQAHLARGTVVEELRMPLGVGIAGTVALTNEPICLADAPADPRFDPQEDRRMGVKTRSLLAMPVTSGGDVLGVVQVVNKRESVFSAEDTEVLSDLLNVAAVALELAG